MSMLAELDRLDWRKFEHLCLVLFEGYYNAPDANFYGANSYGQDGIDIRLTTTVGDIPARVVIQCKAVRSLEWSDFSHDIERALKTFARKTVTEGRLFRFIVATTAEIENTRKFDAQKDKLLDKLALVDIAKHIDFQVYTRLRLQAMGEHGKLRTLFHHPERVADQSPTEELTRLKVRLKRHVHRNEFSSAQRDLADYLHAARPPEPDKYDWLPTDLFDPIASVTLAAGDFVRASSLLNAALGSDPLNAGYLLGFLRARRVLHATPRHNLQRNHLFERPVVIPSPQDNVEYMGSRLLSALGDIDQQMTLALWVVTYAPQEDLAEQGLARALGLVAYTWPSKLPRLDKDAYYRLSVEGYLDRLCGPVSKNRPAPSDEHLCACALTAAYSYIRSVHAARFLDESVRRVEDAHNGWPAVIEGILGENGPTYFSTMLPVCHRALRKNLPSLLAEVSGRNFRVEHATNIMRDVAPKLEKTKYVATPEFLLRDCAHGVVKSRVEELARAGRMGTGATILISHLGLERLIQVQLGQRLHLDEVPKILSRAAIVDGIASLFEHMKRTEPAGHDRLNHERPAFESCPCYANYAAVEHLNSRAASLELARSGRLPFLVSSNDEWRMVEAELPPADPHLIYWQPKAQRVRSQ